MSPTIPADRRYTDGHLWLKKNADGTMDIGATEEGQSQLGDMVFVELPPVGKTFTARDAIATLESVKAASDMYVPVNGTVRAINTALKDQPELVNREPYATWVLRIAADTVDEAALMSAEQYRQMIGSA
jgi:glycine cleavage system H protein